MAVCPDTNSTETDTLLIEELTLETKPEAYSIDERVSTEEPTCSRSYPSQGKYLLVSPTEKQYDWLVVDLRRRLADGNGENIYQIGLWQTLPELEESPVEEPCSPLTPTSPDSPSRALKTISPKGSQIRQEEVPGLSQQDFQASIATLLSLSTACNCESTLLRENKVDAGMTAEYLVRARIREDDFAEVRVAVVGNVDAGKSTLLGVLTHGVLDDGRGLARQRLFRHKHERESGRTSSVGNDILGFNCLGEVVNKMEGHGQMDWVKICKASAKVITFIDLAGHERYLKTTIFGMTGRAPDFCMLMVGANAGVIGMTKEHLGLALALSVPVFIVITKIDMCPENVLKETLKLVIRIVKSPGCRKIPALVQNEDDVITCAMNFSSLRLCPIFQVSNVAGTNLPLLKHFLNLLNGRMPGKHDEPPVFQIDEIYAVPGVGTVVAGTLLQGTIKTNDTLLLGPDGLGQFQPMLIRSIQRKRLNVDIVFGGQTASFALRKIKRGQIHKGMVLIARELKPSACWEFDADILVLHHPTTITDGYQAMVHCGSVKQTATIITMNKEQLRTGDKAACRFRFMKSPEFLILETKLIFREGRTKAVGTVTHLYNQLSGPANKQRLPKNKTAPFPTSKTSKRKEVK